MRVAISIAHPAQVHLFKNFVSLMEHRGHMVKVFHVEKDVTTQLLDSLKIDYVTLGNNGGSFYKNIIAYFFVFFSALIEIIRFNPDIILGRVHPAVAIPSAILGKTFIALEDTENANLNHKLGLPYIDKVITSNCFKKNFSEKQVRLDSYQELAYLHPNYFTPDINFKKERAINKASKYIIFRFVKGTAHHDIEYSYLDWKSKIILINYLASHIRVFIVSEKSLPQSLKKYELNLLPEKMHDALYSAALYIGEGATMATECAILGKPAIYLNEGYTHGTLEDIKEKYNLIYCTTEINQIIKLALRIIKNSEYFCKKRNDITSEKIDINQYLVRFIEDYDPNL